MKERQSAWSSGAGVFLTQQRKSEGSVLPGFLQFPVHAGGGFRGEVHPPRCQSRLQVPMKTRPQDERTELVTFESNDSG